MARLARLIFVCARRRARGLADSRLNPYRRLDGDGPVRVALFAPLWQLWTALAIAALLAGVVLGLAGVGHLAAARSDTMVAPLALMWLWVIPYLPWIPDRAPALLVLAGPLRWGIAALAVAGSAMSLTRLRSPATRSSA